MEVHETELDQYGVVNNVIYTSYIQNGQLQPILKEC